MRIVQIVPAGDPALGGVHGYAEALAGELSRRHSIESDLVSSGGRGGAGGELAGALPGASTCLLHYVNYAYHRRGCPVGLVRDLRRWREGAPGRRLVTFFHEVYATGPFWRSSFWLAPVQRRLAAILARASDRIATSLELYGRMLARLGPRVEPVVTPVFSTVGEPEEVPGLATRAPRLLVFGGRGVRARAYGPEREALAAACGALGAEEIVDLGPAIATPARVDGVPVRALGPLPASAVREQLLGTRAGFLVYPPAFLPKSTIFAAYCAHGLLPVCARPRTERSADDGDPLYWVPGSPLPSADGLQALASAARSWYLPHSLARQAEGFRDLLLTTGAPR
ncbi:MAG TPA: glycosyltransferase family 1 protein [Thermoanaerobaculia bacterium]|nr:glycosyltransferase family 1 protein [Thermoanaerobaculia bacterium]